MFVQPFFTTTIVLMIYAVTLFGITAATEIESVDVTENIGENLAVFVRERLRPGLAGTSLAKNNAILRILAEYLCSPYLPTRPLFRSVSRSICYLQVSADTRTVVTIDTENQTIRTWDLHTGGECTHVIWTNTFTYRAYATTQHVIFESAAVNDMGHLTGEHNQVWDLHTGLCTAIRSKSENLLTSRIISDDEKVALIITFRGVYTWYWSSNELSKSLLLQSNERCFISNENKVLALTVGLGANTVKIYRITDNYSIIYTNTLNTNAHMNYLSVKISVQRYLLGVITHGQKVHI